MTSSCFTIINSRSSVDLLKAEFYTWETSTLCGEECQQYIKNYHKLMTRVLGLIFHYFFLFFFSFWVCGQITFSHFLRKNQIHFKRTSKTDFQDHPTHKISMFCKKAVILYNYERKKKKNLVESMLHVN